MCGAASCAACRPTLRPAICRSIGVPHHDARARGPLRTAQEVLDWFEAKGLEAYSISFGPSLLYNTMFPKHKDRLNTKLSELVQTVGKTELPPSKKHFDVVVACEDDEGEDIDVPLLSIKFR